MSEAYARGPLPPYFEMLSGYHRGFARSLRRMVAGLPISAGQTALDLATGDGAYALWLSELTGPEGLVLAIDLSRPFLRHARDASAPAGGAVAFCQADALRLPLADGSVDLAWCAQSLYSLPEPLPVLREMVRVTRAGGWVAVMENDSLHHLILPWPIDLELALRRAEWKAVQGESGDPQRYYVGRALTRLFREAGLESPRQESWATTRQAPLDEPSRMFFQAQLEALRRRVAPHLDPAHLAELDRLISAESAEHLLGQPDFAATTLDLVVLAER